MVTPLGGDQFYFEQHVQRIGAGVALGVPIENATPDQLASAISAAERLRPNLPHLAKRMLKETGVAAAADEVELFLGMLRVDAVQTQHRSW